MLVILSVFAWIIYALLALTVVVMFIYICSELKKLDDKDKDNEDK